MKLTITVLLSVLLFSCQETEISPEPDTRFEGDVILRSKAQLLEFSEKGITEITGYLHIGFPDGRKSDIDDLSPLSSLGKIRKLYIMDNPNLHSLNGLQELTGVQALFLAGNGKIESIGGLLAEFDSLRNVGIKAPLVDFKGLDQIRSVSYFIIDSVMVSDLSGLSGLKSVELLGIHNCENLKSLEGLQGLTHLGAYTIESNKQLSDYCAINSLIIENRIINWYIIWNAYNPIFEDFLAGNCSQ